jgi:hypothetical protein
MSALNFEYGTDSGPACTACGSTIHGYALNGRNVTARCAGCHAVEYFRAVEDDEITVATLREAHERCVLGRAGKSRGHICFAFDAQVEFYELDGRVYRAPTHNAFDLWGRRHGRFECLRPNFERHREWIVRGVA